MKGMGVTLLKHAVQVGHHFVETWQHPMAQRHGTSTLSLGGKPGSPPPPRQPVGAWEVHAAQEVLRLQDDAVVADVGQRRDLLQHLLDGGHRPHALAGRGRTVTRPGPRWRGWRGLGG